MTRETDSGAIPRVILSTGNITHYHYTALALMRAGYLRRYLFSSGITNPNNRWINHLPENWQKKMKLREIDHELAGVTRFSPASEIISRGLQRAGILSVERSYWLFNELYDLSMLPWVNGGNVFHFVSTIGLHGARKAKKDGNLVICDLRSAYPEFEWSLLKEEYDRLGLHYQPIGESYKQRIMEEFSLADYFIAPSDYVAQTLQVSGYKAEKTFVVPYGVNMERFGIDGESRDGKIYTSKKDYTILFVGSIGPRKGVHYLLRAFSKLKISGAKLVLVGNIENGFDHYLTDFLKTDNRIHLVGHIPHSELHKYYQQASVFVLPSISEGSALVIYEAMAEGLPVITTPNSGSIITNFVDGIIIPIRDDEAILSNLIWLYDHPSDRLEIGCLASQNIHNFDWNNYGGRLLDVYKSILL